jgi:hypothetical protein
VPSAITPPAKCQDTGTGDERAKACLRPADSRAPESSPLCPNHQLDETNWRSVADGIWTWAAAPRSRYPV